MTDDFLLWLLVVITYLLVGVFMFKAGELAGRKRVLDAIDQVIREMQK